MQRPILANEKGVGKQRNQEAWQMRELPKNHKGNKVNKHESNNK